MGEPLFLAVGRLGRPHGVRGDIVMNVLTDFPERLKPGVQVYVGPDRQLLRIVRVRSHGEKLLVAFEGIAQREAAGMLRNQLVLVRAADVPPLPEGEYYHHQLLGLQVVTDQGQPLGRVIEILETGANDVYVVRRETGKDLLLPAIEEVVLEIDLNARRMEVHLLPGLTTEH